MRLKWDESAANKKQDMLNRVSRVVFWFVRHVLFQITNFIRFRHFGYNFSFPPFSYHFIALFDSQKNNKPALNGFENSLTVINAWSTTDAVNENENKTIKLIMILVEIQMHIIRSSSSS